MKLPDLENGILIVLLIVLIAINLVYIVKPLRSKAISSKKLPSIIIPDDTTEEFDRFISEFKEANVATYTSNSWSSGANQHVDDIFSVAYEKGNGRFSLNDQPEEYKPNVPSDKYICQLGWVAIRSEMNYKYLWMHTGDSMWMGATATIDTPLHRKAFELVPLSENCTEGGWVRLREGDRKGFLYMVIPTPGVVQTDEWVVKSGTDDLTISANDTRYHFLLEEDGFLLNRGNMAFINVIPEAEYAVRGHSGDWDRSKPAMREYGAMVHFQIISDSFVQEAIEKEKKEQKEADDEDKLYIEKIKSLPSSHEKRVISFGLYGAKEKYTTGAVRNAELAKIYFPGWVCRYYVTGDVPSGVISQLKLLGAEIESIPADMGYSSGMFWRFLVAADNTVDRYIIRDVDSRLNYRDRIAVEEWIQDYSSKYPIHILRDHINHCIVMNGGMWGGVKGALPTIKEDVMAWSSRDEYMADLHFLENVIWPKIKEKQVAHDSYCCDRYPNTKPFPTRRPYTYQHVGQVFDSEDNPRLMDIDSYIRGVPIPQSCRKENDWIFG